MDHYIPHDYATSNVLAWTTTQSANVEPSAEEDASADADEPPERSPPESPLSKQFRRAPVRRGSGQHQSLLTKALQSYSDEGNESGSQKRTRRRRSITSNLSFASTAELTCDTGITTPARTSSPSPRLSDIGFVPLAAPLVVREIKNGPSFGSVQRLKDPAVQALEKKRCISFACAAKPKQDEKPSAPVPQKPTRDGSKVQEAPKTSCIRFACAPQLPSKAARTTPSQETLSTTPKPVLLPSTPKDGYSSLQKPRSPSTVRYSRMAAPRKPSQSPVVTRSNKWLTANAKDLQSECSRFHEFASDEPLEDDWIRRDDPSSRPKLTINDTLEKENAIRKLGKEAEEEADLEEEEDAENDVDDEEDEEDEDDDDEDRDGDDNEDVDEYEEDNGPSLDYAWDDDASDGYKTDNEIGFADSEDEDDDLVLWTTRREGYQSLRGAAPVVRRPSTSEHSDSSAYSKHRSSTVRTKSRKGPNPIVFRPGTPELPDSTDFVCGTLDEDRPLEEAYISCVAARKRGKHQPIPQDIDPSFPTSDPEDDAEELYMNGHGDSDDNLWIHGELEDIHHERAGRKKKLGHRSPKRCRSPPPKRRNSPAPKARGRSPRRLFDHQSPRKLKSPPPPQTTSQSPRASPAQGGRGIAFKTLAVRPSLTYTKSLPRAPALLQQPKARKSKTGVVTNESHIRGAIDIVKGLEQKRQRRREKFYQKYCNRARKEKAQEKRPPPGQGAQRMREVGLFMAGKTGQGSNYVLSV